MEIKAFKELFFQRVQSELVLEETFLELVLAAYWCREHILFEGPPGTGKTSLAEYLGKMTGDFGRVQMTPETLPSDILGMEVLKDRESLSFEFRKGPIFHSLLVVDEINRANPRTQSALLQAMQERRVQIGDVVYELSENFLVIATLNPTQMDGTFLLPDSQLDRFGLRLKFEQAIGKKLEEILKFSFSPQMCEKVIDQTCSQIPKKMLNEKTSEEWYRVCSELQRCLSLGSSKELGAHPVGVRAFKTWLNLGSALSGIRGHEHLSTQCLRELIEPVFMHRFGPFAESDFSKQLIATFDKATGN